MRGLFSKADLRALSLILAIVLFLGGAPSTAGFVIVSGPSHPELTVNICQPLQMFDQSQYLACPSSDNPAGVRSSRPRLRRVKSAVQPIDFKVAPDTPPPKRLV